MRLYFLPRRIIFTLLRLPLLKRLEAPTREWFRRRFSSPDGSTSLEKGPVFYETFKRVVNQDLLSYAARITAPTLLIWGDADEDTPLEQAHRLEKTIPNAGLVVFEGAGHYAYLERPVDFVRIVTHFFRDEAG